MPIAEIVWYLDLKRWAGSLVTPEAAHEKSGYHNQPTLNNKDSRVTEGVEEQSSPEWSHELSKLDPKLNDRHV